MKCVSNANLFLAAVAEELLIAPEEPDTVRIPYTQESYLYTKHGTGVMFKACIEVYSSQ